VQAQVQQLAALEQVLELEAQELLVVMSVAPVELLGLMVLRLVMRGTLALGMPPIQLGTYHDLYTARAWCRNKVLTFFIAHT
jgi:hypothetical protein